MTINASNFTGIPPLTLLNTPPQAESRSLFSRIKNIFASVKSKVGEAACSAAKSMLPSGLSFGLSLLTSEVEVRSALKDALDELKAFPDSESIDGLIQVALSHLLQKHAPSLSSSKLEPLLQLVVVKMILNYGKKLQSKDSLGAKQNIAVADILVSAMELVLKDFSASIEFAGENEKCREIAGNLLVEKMIDAFGLNELDLPLRGGNAITSWVLTFARGPICSMISSGIEDFRRQQKKIVEEGNKCKTTLAGLAPHLPEACKTISNWILDYSSAMVLADKEMYGDLIYSKALCEVPEGLRGLLSHEETTKKLITQCLEKLIKDDHPAWRIIKPIAQEWLEANFLKVSSNLVEYIAGQENPEKVGVSPDGQPKESFLLNLGAKLMDVASAHFKRLQQESVSTPSYSQRLQTHVKSLFRNVKAIFSCKEKGEQGNADDTAVRVGQCSMQTFSAMATSEEEKNALIEAHHQMKVAEGEIRRCRLRLAKEKGDDTQKAAWEKELEKALCDYKKSKEVVNKARHKHVLDPLLKDILTICEMNGPEGEGLLLPSQIKKLAWQILEKNIFPPVLISSFEQLLSGRVRNQMALGLVDFFKNLSKAEDKYLANLDIISLKLLELRQVLGRTLRESKDKDATGLIKRDLNVLISTIEDKQLRNVPRVARTWFNDLETKHNELKSHLVQFTDQSIIDAREALKTAIQELDNTLKEEQADADFVGQGQENLDPAQKEAQNNAPKKLKGSQKQLDEKCGTMVRNFLEMIPASVSRLILNLDAIKSMTNSQLGAIVRLQLGKKWTLVSILDHVVQSALPKFDPGEWVDSPDPGQEKQPATPKLFNRRLKTPFSFEFGEEAERLRAVKDEEAAKETQQAMHAAADEIIGNGLDYVIQWPLRSFQKLLYHAANLLFGSYAKDVRKFFISIGETRLYRALRWACSMLFWPELFLYRQARRASWWAIRNWHLKGIVNNLYQILHLDHERMVAESLGVVREKLRP